MEKQLNLFGEGDELERRISSYQQPQLRIKPREIGYRIGGYSDAERILRNWEWNKGYLRSLVARLTGDGEYADGLDYNTLRYHGHKIRAVAEKILRSKRKKG